MNAPTIIATILLVVVVFLALRYIYKEKKKGTKCIGCPFADEGGCHLAEDLEKLQSQKPNCH